MDKKQREERRRQEDIALQRGLLWVVGAIVLEALLVLVNRFYINYYISEVEFAIVLGNLLRVLRMVAPVATLAALVWTGWQLKQGKKFTLPLVLTVALGACSVCSHVIIKFYSQGMSMLFWLVAAWGVLALVYYIYQKELFLSASACGMSVLAIWFARYGAAGRLEAILILAAIAVVGGASLWLKQSGGVLPGKEKVRFLPKKADYTVPLVTCLASLLAVLAAMLLSGAAYYLIFVMIAWLFALFVYYTVKLM